MNKIVTRLSEDGCVVRINNELGTVHRGDEIKTSEESFFVKSYDFEKDTFWAIKKNEYEKTFEIAINDVISVKKSSYKDLENLVGSHFAFH